MMVGAIKHLLFIQTVGLGGRPQIQHRHTGRLQQSKILGHIFGRLVVQCRRELGIALDEFGGGLDIHYRHTECLISRNIFYDRLRLQSKGDELQPAVVILDDRIRIIGITHEILAGQTLHQTVQLHQIFAVQHIIGGICRPALHQCLGPIPYRHLIIGTDIRNLAHIFADMQAESTHTQHEYHRQKSQRQKQTARLAGSVIPGHNGIIPFPV